MPAKNTEEKHTSPEPEAHPLPPFIPEGAKLIMMGSAPPPASRWTMDFYYPNFQNDMWRIFGLVFFGDRNHFLGPDGKAFSKERLVELLTAKRIALSDTAAKVIRHNGNASDKFLQIVERRDVAGLLALMPLCTVMVTTGDKAAATLAEITGSKPPKMGGYEELTYAGRALRHYRMPSSSRAYPLPLESKAAVYTEMFRQCGLL